MQTKDFDTLVSEQVTAIQGGSSSLVDLSIGSVLRAIVEGYAAVAMWLQSLVLQLVSITRASTSSGADLDTWVSDYGLSRLPAVAATGTVTFSRFTATAQATIPAGSVVQTADGEQKYATQSEVTIPAGTSSANVLVKALTPGQAANSIAGSINKLGQALPGIDTVSNELMFTNGSDAESDVSLRIRFVSYIASLSKATKSAVGFAASSVSPSLIYSLVENTQFDGTVRLGYFYLVVDDGTGTPSQQVLTNVYNAVDAVRPISVAFDVYPPRVVLVNVLLTVDVAAGYDNAAVESLVKTSIVNYLNSFPISTNLVLTRIIQVAYNASPGVYNVSSISINGKTEDISVTINEVLKAGTVVVN